MKTILLILALALGGYIAAIVWTNRNATPSPARLDLESGVGARASARDRLTVMTWNLGYAGLGAESDFIADGGRSILAPSRAVVDKNLAGIVKELSMRQSDVYALQEVSATSPLNYWRPVWRMVRQTKPRATAAYWTDVASRLVPYPLRLDHGIATLAAVRPQSAELVPLPMEPKYWFGVLRKQYALMVTRYPIAGQARQWVVANLHLAAFDDGGDTRRKQLSAVMAFAEAEFKAGHFVVLAGDWNMVLGGPERPHRTEKRHLDWVHPLPVGGVGGGWKVAIDASVPTVRTLYKSYVPGENFVATIDGFVVSPNVEVAEVQTIDLAFQFSDHNPVVATFIAKPIERHGTRE